MILIENDLIKLYELSTNKLDIGFRLNTSLAIVLTITYMNEQNSHQDRSGVRLNISTRM
jgi:hypothetical protein